MKIKEQIILLLVLSVSFCLVSFIFEVVVDNYSMVTEKIDVWFLFFSGVCVSMGFISFGFMLHYVPDTWNEKLLSFIGLSNEDVVGFSNKTVGLVMITVGTFGLFLSSRQLFINLGYLI